MQDTLFPVYILIFFTTLILTAIIEKKLIPRLAEHAKQPIYAEGPRWHMKKKGTPTMGGIAFLISISLVLISASLFTAYFISEEVSLAITLSLLYAMMNSFIGIIDDYRKLKKKENAGLTPWQKIFLQLAAAILFISLRQVLLDEGTAISFAFGEVELGLWYYPLTVVFLLGIVNCANLTDGIDGLASSVAFSIGVSLFYISFALNEETAIISSALIGATVGFLIFNLHPAKIFMGDTGSLFFGALIASAALTLNNPLIVTSVCGVYFLEGISDILQVAYFKMTRKRIFKMAPLHHHLEKCGWSENKICIAAILATFVFSIPAYALYLP